MNQRKSYLDMSKGIGILVVMLAHVLDEKGTFRTFLYTFHMPLFL